MSLGSLSPPSEMLKFDGAKIWHEQDRFLVSWRIVHPWTELSSLIIKMWIQYFLLLLLFNKKTETRLSALPHFWSKYDLLMHALTPFQSQHLTISTAFVFWFSTKIQPLGPKSAPWLSVHGCTWKVLGLMASRGGMQANITEFSGD